MLREMIVITAFLFLLAGITAGVVIIQKGVTRQEVKAVAVMEQANEID